MRKNQQKRALLATAEGVKAWESDCKFNSPKAAADKLGVPLRTYHRYKAEGLPGRLQRETILDRMEASLSNKKRG